MKVVSLSGALLLFPTLCIGSSYTFQTDSCSGSVTRNSGTISTSECSYFEFFGGRLSFHTEGWLGLNAELHPGYGVDRLYSAISGRVSVDQGHQVLHTGIGHGYLDYYINAWATGNSVTGFGVQFDIGPLRFFADGVEQRATFVGYNGIVTGDDFGNTWVYHVRVPFTDGIPYHHQWHFPATMSSDLRGGGYAQSGLSMGYFFEPEQLSSPVAMYPVGVFVTIPEPATTLLSGAGLAAAILLCKLCKQRLAT